MEALTAGTSRSRAKLLRVASVAFLAPLASIASIASAQEVVRQWFGDGPGQQFGTSIAWVGDVNADGFVDIGVVAPYDGTVNSYGGMLRVISGKDGAVLHSFYGDAVNAELGLYGLGHPIGDIDRDGYDDVLVSEYDVHGYPYYGRIFIFSGRDGSVLLKLSSSSTQSLGTRICGTGDVDGDGVPDFAVTSASGNSVLILSGATGATIRTLQALDPASAYFGRALLNPGDIDGDGVDDLIVLENGCYYPSQMNYYAFSGSTGAAIWTTRAWTYCQWLSTYIDWDLSPVVIGDIDGDGIPDWADGERYFWGAGPRSGGNVNCHSGKDGSYIRSVYNPLYGSPAATSFGKAVAAAGDVNGDGVADLAASDVWFCDDPGGDVFFYSGSDGTMLFHCRGTASAAAFGTAIAGGLDPDGDSKLDMLVGDTSDKSNGSNAGAVSQLRIEPITLDLCLRNGARVSTKVRVNGGIPGNPLAIFLDSVNGVVTFNLVEVRAFDAARHFEEWWNIPSGLTGITAKLVAFSLDASGRLEASNYETIVIP